MASQFCAAMTEMGAGVFHFGDKVHFTGRGRPMYEGITGSTVPRRQLGSTCVTCAKDHC